MSESDGKLTIELVHQKLNASFKRFQGKKEKVEAEEKALAEIKKQVKEKALAVWNEQQFMGSYRNCGKYGHKVVEKKRNKKINN